ncbi:hypothetical protein RGQ29_006929 [Quercus rubra]|uniref:Protein FRA10AC1 n=1 Tax=Quercus rubra TaxID=3512 RepID=A0AAN7IDB9_QUERU|nr:hypothetical protein RGQ29_006929 [Quercus rubra]
MSHYKTGKIGLRWRAEKEVISGKGQFICGNKHCDEKDDLASYETSVNFSYSEAGENKQALVKLVTCERCADELHYKRQKEKEQSEKREQAENKRKRCQFKPKAFFCARAYLLLIKIPFTYSVYFQELVKEY